MGKLSSSQTGGDHTPPKQTGENGTTSSNP
jgi:hypothetical protein